MKPDEELAYAKEFFSLANAITAFSVLQMVAYLFKASDNNIHEGIINLRYPILAAIVLGTAFYGVVVGFLARWQISLLEDNGVTSLSQRLRFISSVRIVVIAIAGVAGFAITGTL